MDIQKQILCCISDLKNGLSPAPDDPLIYEGFLDSFDVIQVIQFMEETFQISIGDEDLTPETFSTVRTLAQFVKDSIQLRHQA